MAPPADRRSRRRSRRVYLRGGTVFIVVAVVGSLLLTDVARVGAARRARGTGVERSARRAVAVDPAVPADRRQHPAVRRRLRPERARASAASWQPNDGLVADRSSCRPTDKHRYYWRAVAYDEFDAERLERRARRRTRRESPANAPLLDGTAEPTTWSTRSRAPSRSPSRHAGRDSGPIVLSPLTPDRASTVPTDADAGRRRTAYLGAIERRGGGPYTVTRLVRDRGQRARRAQRRRPCGPPAPTTRRRSRRSTLGASRTARSRTAARPRRCSTSSSRGRGRRQPVSTSPSTCASGSTSQVERRLFKYDTDVSDLMSVQCKDISIVECFATYQARLLPVLRDDDGDLPARAGHPDPRRRGLPAGHAERARASRTDHGTATPRLGRGLLPGLRLGHVRPDRRRRRAQLAPLPSGAGRRRGAAPPPAARPSGARPGPDATAGPEPDDGGHRPARPARARSAAVHRDRAPARRRSSAALAFVAWQRGPRGRDDAPTVPIGR